MKVSLRGLRVGQWPQAGFSQLHTSLLFKLGRFQDPAKGKKIKGSVKSIELRQETTSPSFTSIKTATLKKKKGVFFCLERQFWAQCEQAVGLLGPCFSCPQSGCHRWKNQTLFSVLILSLSVVFELLCKVQNPFTSNFTWETLKLNAAQCSFCEVPCNAFLSGDCVESEVSGSGKWNLLVMGEKLESLSHSQLSSSATVRKCPSFSWLCCRGQAAAGSGVRFPCCLGGQPCWSGDS